MRSARRSALRSLTGPWSVGWSGRGIRADGAQRLVRRDLLLLVDERSCAEGRGLARFFLHDFLGCQLSASAEKATKDFWNATQAFINDDVASPEKKGRCQVAGQAFLEEPEEDLRPEAFIQRAVDLNDQPKIRQRVRDEGLEPSTTVPKDTGLIARKISGFQVTFAHEMTLVGGPEDLEQERLELSENGSGPTTIRDAIKTMSGR